MVRAIRSFPLLKGVRGEAPANLAALTQVILTISSLVNDFPEMAEADINPLLVLPRGQGAVAVDARMTLTRPKLEMRHSSALRGLPRRRGNHGPGRGGAMPWSKELDAPVFLVERYDNECFMDNLLTACDPLGDRLIGVVMNAVPTEMARPWKPRSFLS